MLCMYMICLNKKLKEFQKLKENFINVDLELKYIFFNICEKLIYKNK